MEPFYPLHVRVCASCLLVQLPEYVSPADIFTEYAYFSSYAASWLEHARAYAEMIQRRLGLGRDSLVVELASNDGYLLQHFDPLGVPVLGIEPARNVAAVAIDRGIPTITEFFGAELATRLVAEGRRPDLLVGNNVFAHVPDLNDFVAGMQILLASDGVITLEFPHLARLFEQNQFDTIYHEHFSYYSFIVACRVLAEHGLTVFDVEELPTHGGSLRVYARHQADESKPVELAVPKLLAEERAAGFDRLEHYLSFGPRVEAVKRGLLDFLIRAKEQGTHIAGYGAPGKGNTLLNYCGIRTDFLDYTVDRNPYKHGRFLPGSRIPVHPPSKIGETKPDYVLILPWNLRTEIEAQLAYVRQWGARFVIAIPDLEVW
jgi:C-methyltransferase C-terminal domain/Methyltransferase domain/Putative zinc binding domain